METVEFRSAVAADMTRLLALLSERKNESNALHGTSGNSVLQEGPAIFQQMLQRPDVTVLIGELQGKIVATVTMYLLPRIRTGGSIAILEDVLVAKDMRGQGIGSQIMKYAIEVCKSDKRIKKIKLGSRKDEEAVHDFYQKLGFEYKEILFQRTP